MNMDEMDEQQERIQKALNDAKKREIEEKFGADFFEASDNLPADIEAAWLHNIEEFELQYKHGTRITVRAFAGNPEFKNLQEISPDTIASELESVLDVLNEKNIFIDFLEEVPLKERYRFITEELLDEETDDISIEGMNHHFIYEEFHPNDTYDSKMFAEYFLHYLFDKNIDMLMSAFSKEEIIDPEGNTIAWDEMKREVERFMDRFSVFMKCEYECTGANVHGDDANVSIELEWEGLESHTMKNIAASGLSVIRLKRSPYSGWDVVQPMITGWNI